MSKIEKINDLLLNELAVAVNRELVMNEALVTITYVQCSSDLKQAKIGFSVLPDKLAGTTLRKLIANTKNLADILRKRTKLRQLPRLIWEFDATEKEASKLERLIAAANEEDNI